MSRALLTYEQIAEWRRRLVTISEDEQRLVRERSDIERKLAAVAVLFGEVTNEPMESVPAAEAIDPPIIREPWRIEVMSIFEEKRKGLTYDELKQAVENGHLNGELAKSDKGFYHAVARLQLRGDLIRHKKRLFRPTDLKGHLDLVESGSKPDLPEFTAYRRSPMGDEMKLYLQMHPTGVTGAAIIEHLKGDPRFVETLTKHSTGGYNVLARLVVRGEITKDGRNYFPVPTNDTEKL